jgi:hypothetical protein
VSPWEIHFFLGRDSFIQTCSGQKNRGESPGGLQADVHGGSPPDLVWVA